MRLLLILPLTGCAIPGDDESNADTASIVCIIANCGTTYNSRSEGSAETDAKGSIELDEALSKKPTGSEVEDE